MLFSLTFPALLVSFLVTLAKFRLGLSRRYPGKFQVVVLLLRRILDVVHFRRDLHDLDLLQGGVEVLHLLAGIIAAVPLELAAVQRFAQW